MCFKNTKEDYQKEKTLLKNILDRYGHDSTRFGGLIYSHDFNTNYNTDVLDNGYDSDQGSEIATRIKQDFIFDEQCRQNLKSHPYHHSYDNELVIHPWRSGRL